MRQLMMMMMLLVTMLGFNMGCRQSEKSLEEAVTDHESEKAKVQIILDCYTEALRTKNTGMLAEIFSQDDDVVMLDGNTPSRFIGWEALKERYQAHFDSYEKLDITYRDLIIKLHASSEVAWLTCVFDWNCIFQGQRLSTEGLRATWVLEKKNGKWKIVQVHFSFPRSDNK